MSVSPIGLRLRKFREEKGLSQHDLANQLGVGKITILRWENGTSKPSPLAAEKLEQIGFGKLGRNETKRVSTPRLMLQLWDRDELRDGIRKSIRIGRQSFDFDPSPYVVNGPEDQIPFFETLYSLQELPASELPSSASEYGRRLSLVATIPELGLSTAQYKLENPRPIANHWNPNYGSHGWHRYVGRFPPHLVRALLNHFGARKGETVCDPFAGSGTTLVESRLLGLKGVGIEISPLSSLISRTKSKFPQSTSSWEKVLEALPRFYHNRWDRFVGNRDVKRLSHNEILDRRGNPIDAFPNYEKWLIPEALLGTSIIVEFALTLDGFARDAVCLALSSRMRSIGNVDVDVVRAEYSRAPRSEVNVLKHVQTALHKMVTDIHEMVTTHRDLLSASGDIQVIEKSLLDANLPSNSVDYIITSPPYGVESLSYLRTHLLSYRCLQPILRYDPYKFDTKVIGSEYTKENGTVKPTLVAGKFSKTFVEFFEGELFRDGSRHTHYRKEMMMYFFDDMAEVAERFHKWLRPGGRVAFVMGNKKIGDHVIPTDRIVAEIFESCGLQLDRVLRHKLKCNNSNSEVPWQERIIQDEHVMIFTRMP